MGLGDKGLAFASETAVDLGPLTKRVRFGPVEREWFKVTTRPMKEVVGTIARSDSRAAVGLGRVYGMLFGTAAKVNWGLLTKIDNELGCDRAVGLHLKNSGRPASNR